MSLSRKRLEKLDIDLAVFRFDLAQDLFSLLTHIENMKITTDEFKEWVLYRQEQIKISSKKRFEPPKGFVKFICPECNLPLVILPVNTRNCDQVGGKYKTQVLCRNWLNCGYEEYSTKSLEEWEHELRSQSSTITRNGCGGEKE